MEKFEFNINKKRQSQNYMINLTKKSKFSEIRTFRRTSPNFVNY